MIRVFGFLLVIIAGLVSATAAFAQTARPDPFAVLRQAYATKEAKLAASAYAPDGLAVYAYDGVPEERVQGAVALERSFKVFFDQIAAGQRLDLNFRVVERSAEAARGFYRLRFGDKVAYGGFDVRLAGDVFSFDRSSSATAADFEYAAGPVMFAVDDETLDRSVYGQLTGRYRAPDGCVHVVTRSVVRLFVRNTCTHAWRGLNRVSGLEWTAGDTVRSSGATTTVRFAPPIDGKSPSITIAQGAGSVRAVRTDAYTTQDVSFRSADGTTLAGTLYVPTGSNARRPATVLIHGSGPQDRDGYASIIAVLADELAAQGRVVLAYDKRGSGGSGGDGGRASFDVLAQDLIAGLALLRARDDVDAARVGVAGSSQAGWIAAKVVAMGGAPADVFLLGAAGTALTVEAQNIYNTDVQMRCQGVAPRDRRLALDQQRAFFRFLEDPKAGARLDALTARGQARAGLSDWLFPNSAGVDRSADAWYVALDLAFDPLPVWRAYAGRATFVFGEFDDATPTAVAMGRVRGLRGVETVVLDDAQHLGLVAADTCRASLNDVSRFAPGLFTAIAAFAQR